MSRIHSTFDLDPHPFSNPAFTEGLEAAGYLQRLDTSEKRITARYQHALTKMNFARHSEEFLTQAGVRRVHCSTVQVSRRNLLVAWRDFFPYHAASRRSFSTKIPLAIPSFTFKLVHSRPTTSSSSSLPVSRSNLDGLPSDPRTRPMARSTLPSRTMATGRSL